MEFKNMKRSEIIEYLKEMNVKGYSGMKKNELVELAEKTFSYGEKVSGSGTPAEIAKRIVEKYRGPDTIIRVRANGVEYNYHGWRELREKTGPAVESLTVKTMDSLLAKGDVALIVYERPYTTTQVGRSHYYIPTKIIHQEVITSKKRKPGPAPSGSKGRELVEQYFKSLGYELDNWGHLKKRKSDGSLWRVVLMDKAFRLEEQMKFSSHNVRWIKRGGGYYKYVSIVNGRLRISKD